MEEYIQKQNSLFQSGAEQRFKRRNDWNIFENYALNSFFKDYVNEVNKAGYYEKLYVIISPEDQSGLKAIQLYAGAHPTGLGNMTGEGLDIEHSGALVIAQDVRGHVFFKVYPSSSKYMQWKDDFFILKHFKNPRKIFYNDLRKASDFYLRFARYTSVYSELTYFEKMELGWMKFELKKNIPSIIKIIASALRLFIFSH
jgi:hypothetical protein